MFRDCSPNFMERDRHLANLLYGFWGDNVERSF